MRKGPGRAMSGGRRNQAGSKIARKFAKHKGVLWRGEVVHGGELTAAADKRAGRPKGWARYRPEELAA